MKLGLLFSVSDLLETYNSLSQLQLSVAVSHLSFESSQHVSFALTKYENLSSYPNLPRLLRLFTVIAGLVLGKGLNFGVDGAGFH